MKLIALFLLGFGIVSGGTVFAQASPLEGEYGIHLFFNETEAIDVINFRTDKNGVIVGNMHVPGDFDGPLLNTTLAGNKIEFDLFVPKNSSRPKDLVFHYIGEFFNDSKIQLTGYVTLKGENDFVASFVGFKR